MSAVDDRYVDAFGVERSVPQSTRDTFTALIEAAADPDALVPHSVVVRAGAAAHVTVSLPAAAWTERCRWTIALEDGGTRSGANELREAPVVGSFARDGALIDRRVIALGDVPLGYHQLRVEIGAYGSAEARLIVVPRRAFTGPDVRQWGIAVQLYTLRSQTNWGIGDFGDLLRLITLAADVRADYVGLNPLHAPHRSDPAAASPYAPTSRRFLNWLYIDVEAIPDAADPRIRALLREPVLQAELRALREAPLVDYVGVAAVKDRILRRCFELASARRDAGFAAFVAREGQALERFAAFETLVERYGRDVTSWPAGYRDPQTEDVRAFVARERPAIDYAMYLQYQATRQWDAAARIARRQGVALYRDLAVGVDRNGADVWIEPHAYIPSVSVGAPPDQLNPDGQDWGLPPLHPRALARDGYAALAELFRANMHGAGALRIDHAMSLARLFWSPRGAPALEGTYVAYPFDDMLGVLALESTRVQCRVIGEDLGTVPPGFRDRMADAGVLSYRILFFERESDGSFIPADRYPHDALAATGTHDLATFAAWFDGDDIALRARLGVGDSNGVEAERQSRAIDRDRLVIQLQRDGDLDGDSGVREVMIGAHRFLARSPARIVMMQIDDAIGERLPVNVPGTSDEYPNWRRKLRLDLEEIAHEPGFAALCAMMRAERPRPD